MHDLLLSESIPPSLVDLLVARYADAQTSEDTLVQSLVEIISDIKEPMVILPTPQLEKQKRERQLQVYLTEVLSNIFACDIFHAFVNRITICMYSI